MADLTDTVIAYDVISKINKLQRNILHHSTILKGLDSKNLTIDLRKKSGELLGQYIVESLEMLDSFMISYPDQDRLEGLLQTAGTTKASVISELASISSIESVLKSTLENVKTEDDLNSLGSTLVSMTLEEVDQLADREEQYTPCAFQVICWDLVSAIAMCMLGIDPGDGSSIIDLEEKRKRITLHIKAFERLEFGLGNSTEETDLINAVRLAKEILQVEVTDEELAEKGLEIDNLVPRIPLVRRHWQYGD